MAEFISGQKAAELIKSYSNVCIIGNISLLEPETILFEIEKRYLEKNEPKGLTILFPVFIGSMENRGIDYFAHEGLVKKAIGGSYASMGPNKRFNDLIFENKVEAYDIPMGSFYKLLEATGAGQPGLFTKVGLNTHADPRISGSKLNELTKEDIVKVVNVEGEEYLFYPRLKVDISIIRGTSADEKGNIYLDNEPTSQGIFDIALAAKNNGGIVIAQVRRRVKSGTINPKLGLVPGKLVDYIVIDERDEAVVSHHDACTYSEVKQNIEPKPLDFNHRKVVLRRMLLELGKNNLVNLGFGIPAQLPTLAVEEGVNNDITFTIEHGAIGGVPGFDGTFAVSVNPEIILESRNIFDLYTCGMLDATCLGMGEADMYGNVCNHKFKNMIAGPGGFNDITYKTKKILFGATFTVGGLVTNISEGKIEIIKEGRIPKFSSHIESVTYNAIDGLKKGQEVLYITERCVFKLAEGGIELIEIAPGIDLDRDIRSLLDFDLKISSNLKLMDPRIFKEELMGVKY